MNENLNAASNYVCFLFQEVSSIFGVIAAILHIGNIEFVEKQTQGHTGDGVEVDKRELTDIGILNQTITEGKTIF